MPHVWPRSLQSSVLLLVLSGVSGAVEAKGEAQVVALEVRDLSPVQMGNVKVSDLFYGLTQGKQRLQRSRWATRSIFH